MPHFSSPTWPSLPSSEVHIQRNKVEISKKYDPFSMTEKGTFPSLGYLDHQVITLNIRFRCNEVGHLGKGLFKMLCGKV